MPDWLRFHYYFAITTLSLRITFIFHYAINIDYITRLISFIDIFISFSHYYHYFAITITAIDISLH
jgi:hypothetical protein